jgi:glycosyltransferase involved in cell wall biosynthesis
VSLDHETFVRIYEPPVADPAAPRPQVRFCRRGEGAARRLVGQLRALRRRRLAYVDTHFPWRRSGFRYDEALALHELRPDTLFFSLWKLVDPFPAPVRPLADFPRIATTAGVTDVYAIFLDCAAGLLGDPLVSASPELHPMVAPDLASILARSGMRLHVGLYPGGGLTLSDERLELARRVCERAATAFTWVPEVAGFPHAVTVPPAVVNTRFYAPVARDWNARPLRVLFAADASPRKGLDATLAAFDRLDERFALDVVGPHAARAAELLHPERVTFHGWAGPDGLRERIAAAHVFVCPVRPEATAGGTMIDGFPTTSGSSAMSSGALLVAGNPRGDHSVLAPGRTHVELDPADADSLVAALERVEADREGAQRLASTGSRVVRATLDVRQAMRGRLQRIGLLEPEGDGPMAGRRR